MPTYDYRCPACDNRWEITQSFKDPHPGCPLCDTEGRRMISAPAVHMRGHEAVPRGSSSPRTTPRNLDEIPTATQDGGLNAADGTPILNPDGSRA